ncbi:MAG: aminopeptidase P family protein [Clostridia bacterium]|nr:aminopeptidase P family protein [Clostridia bacterium]
MKGKYEKIKKSLPNEADAILLTSQVSQYYATGFDFEDGYVLVTKDDTYIICDFRYIEAAQECAKDQKGLQAVLTQRNTLEELFGKNGIKTVMFEEERLSVSSLELLKKRYPLVTFVCERGLLASLRDVKDGDEIENIIKAQRIAEKAFEDILPRLNCKMTENDVALELDFAMRRLGAQGSSFKTIAINGTSSSRPHGVPSDKLLQRGFLTMDFGALYCGYCSDMTRTVYIGRPSDEEKDVYNTVLCAQLSALQYLECGGRDCFEADKTARDIIDAKYKGSFGHSLGHGVGLEIHESPRLSPRANGEMLKEGNVVTIEPGIYLPGKYGVRIEDMAVIYDGMAVNITKAPKDLIQIC